MENNKVTITDIDIPFLRLIAILFRWLAALVIVGTVVTLPVLFIWALILVAIFRAMFG